MSENIKPPIQKGNYPSQDKTTHIRVYRETRDKLRGVADEWNTTMIEALRYLIDLASIGEIRPNGKDENP